MTVRIRPPHTNSFFRKPKSEGSPKQRPASSEKTMTFFMLRFCLTDFKALMTNKKSAASKGASKYFRKNNINGFIILLYFRGWCHNPKGSFPTQTPCLPRPCR